MKYRAIIPAAGQGKRMKAGKNKQWIMLDDKPLIAHTLTVFQQDVNCEAIILVINEKEKQDFQALIEDFSFSKVAQLVHGGAERQDSVFNGLKALTDASPHDVILVHDGARPFVTHDMIRRVAEKAAATGAAVLAVPIKDTLKRADGSAIIETVDRTGLWAAQTPQAFHYQLLYDANLYAEKHNFSATDDASLVEMFGHTVSIVESDATNIKLTTPEDLVFADLILKWKKGML